MTPDNTFIISCRPMKASEMLQILETGSSALDRYLGQDIYFNTDLDYLQSVRHRLATTVRTHLEKVGDKPTVLLRAPGRLNAFLEYLDMCAGDHMSTTIDGDMPICVSMREDDTVRVFNARDDFQDTEFSITGEIDLFRSATWDREACEGLEDNWDNRTRIYPYSGRRRGDWVNYVICPFLRVAWEAPDVDLKGVDITFGESSIPLRGGTSSSSAVVVLSFLALYIANHDLLPKWSIQHACKLLGEAEWYVGTHGGANDQTTILRNVPNSILYNRHSQPELDSTILPSLKGVGMIVANSLWEANKAMGANHVFNLRKGWMDLGDDLMQLIISTVCEHLDGGGAANSGWITKLIRERLGFDFETSPTTLESNLELWQSVRSNYREFGSLDDTLLGVPSYAIVELINLLPEEISVLHAARILKKDELAMERDYTMPHSHEGGYRPRAAARFFYKENIIGRSLEKLFLEADSRLSSGEISLDSPQYEEYQIRVGRMLEELQDTLRDDFQVSNSQLDILLHLASRGPGYLGGKLTGAGCGGCVVIMVREGTEGAMCKYLDRCYYSKGTNFTIYREQLAHLSVEDANPMLATLNYALHDLGNQRRVVTFSRGAGPITLPEQPETLSRPRVRIRIKPSDIS